MPFWSYKSISDVANAFQITGEKKEFIKPLDVPVSEAFRAELKFILEEVYFNNSESVCENFIYPTLKEVWKSHTGVLQVWGLEPLNFDENLSGVPDYFVARRSLLGKMMRHVPLTCCRWWKPSEITLKRAGASAWPPCLPRSVSTTTPD